MKQLLEELQGLKKGRLKHAVGDRMREFEEAGRLHINEVFKEACFCILTANFQAERSMRIQEEIGGCFTTLPEKKLSGRLRKAGHRFPNTRAEYIVESRKCVKGLEKALKTLEGDELRDWIVENVKGLGMKEASHFLRNIGHRDYAIVDFHIVDLLVRHGLIKRPKTLSRKKYLEIEGVLRKIAAEASMSLAELDLYLWYMETGKVLK